MMRKPINLLAVVLLCLSCACIFVFVDSAYADDSDRTKTQISVTGFPKDYVADVGDAFDVTPTVKDELSNVLAGKQCSISSSDAAVASVDGFTVTAAGIGSADIVFAFDGDETYKPCTYTVPLDVYGGKLESGGFTAHILSKPSGDELGTCKIDAIGADAVADDGSVVVPSAMTDADGASYTVTQVGYLISRGSSLVSSGAAATMTSLSIPACVERLDNRAFRECSALTTVTIAGGSQLKAIDNGAFQECTALETIDVSGCTGLKSIGDYAFYRCGKLSGITFPGGLETVGIAAFSRCSSLKSVVVPASVTELSRKASWSEVGAFYLCESLESVVIEQDGKLEAMPYAFYQCTKLASVQLGEGIKNISANAFHGCSALTEVTIPASVETMSLTNSSSNADPYYGAYGPFSSCSSLQSVTIAAGSKLRIAYRAFMGSGVVEADISAADKLEDYRQMFSSCTSLKTLRLPDIEGLDLSIAPNARALENVVLPQGSIYFTTDASGAVYTADGSMLIFYPAILGTRELVLPEGCVSVGCHALRYNTALESLTFATASDDGYIDDHGLAGCTSLTTVNFAGEIFGYIGEYAFSGCSALETINIPGLTAQEAYSDYYTDRGSEVYSSGYIVSPSSTRTPVKTPGVGTYAFMNCTALKNIRFGADPDLGCYALVDSSSSAFLNCTALESVAFDGRQPYWMDDDASIGSRVQGSGFKVYAQYLPYFGSDEHAPYYYAVNYYLTKAEAQADDASASNRLARTEFVRGTSVASIATGDASLTSSVFSLAPTASSARYKDGQVLDPNAVAAENGMSGNDWVWAFEEHFGEYGDLYDSCYVYLAHAADLGVSYVQAAPLASMREPIRSTISSSFDVNRWFGENKYGEDYVPANGFSGDTYVYKNCFDSGYYNEKVGYGQGTRPRFDGSCYFTCGASGFIEAIGLYAGDGTLLHEGVDYRVTYQRAIFDDDTGVIALETVERPVTAGPYLLTFTAVDGGSCAAGSVYARWVLAKAHADIVQLYDLRGGSDASYTVSMARQPYSCLRPTYRADTLAYSDDYSIQVSNNDVLSAVLGCEVAGLSKACVYMDNVNITTTTGGFVAKIAGSSNRWTRDGSTAAEMAVFTYTHLNENEARYGFTARPWGNIALLAAPSEEANLVPLSTFCYQMKAPVFFLDDTGVLNEQTLACLKDFKQVMLVGDEQLMSDSIVEELVDAGVASVGRIAYAAGDCCGLSLAVSEALMNAGIPASVSAICDGSDRMDAIAANNYVGFVGGIAPVATSTADAKRVVAWLYEMRDNVSEVRIYGRTDGAIADYDIAAAIMPGGWDETSRTWDGALSIWDVDMAAVVAQRTTIAAGDTLCLHGMLLELQEDGTLAYAGTNYYGIEPLLKGEELACEVLSVDENTGLVTSEEVKRTLSNVPSGYKADSRIGVSASSLELVAGEQAQVGYVYTGNGQLSCATDADAVATTQLVDGVLEISAVGYGSAEITLSAPETDIYKAASRTVTADVSRAKQAISVETDIAKETGDDPFSLNANALGDVPLTYKSSKESVATVDENGIVTVVGAGTATITISAARTDAYTAATAKVTLTVTKGLPANTITTAASTYVKTVGDAAFSLGATARGNAELSYESSDSTVAAVSADGVVTVIGEGTTTITITSARTSTYKQTSCEVTIVVKEASEGDSADGALKAQKVTAKKTKVTKTYKKAKKGKLKNKLAAKKTIGAKALKKLFGLSAKGALTFKKANKKGAGKIAISSAGKVTIKKGLKKGTYKVKIAVHAKATSTYKASAAKNVYLVVKVK